MGVCGNDNTREPPICRREVLVGGDSYIGKVGESAWMNEIMIRDRDGLAIKCRSFSQGRALALGCSVLTFYVARAAESVYPTPADAGSWRHVKLLLP